METQEYDIGLTGVTGMCKLILMQVSKCYYTSNISKYNLEECLLLLLVT